MEIIPRKRRRVPLSVRIPREMSIWLDEFKGQKGQVVEKALLELRTKFERAARLMRE